MPSITVLGRDTCEDTVRVRAHLAALSIAHDYRNVELDPLADALIRTFNAGERVTPTILLGDPSAPTRVLIEPTNAVLDAAIAELTTGG